ncbi:phosphoglycerate kinase [Candidatus Xianfuyuplasma coldseepsis]|uniref:Phosphoglycerate kinase n=1 Tax=Candidatus Xianfuyuplasma coldseepsis TaxID=2782163 RepID=A0A7L7KP22_9MOLU|nr:phosphoglycerate kinase [Xianfuyuplasma coldseepsis]QMS84417.1 phosphoglycerate kinase [Xianfuyuplasma coldseepsis]
MAKKIVRDVDVKGKTVLCRVDFNVPMIDGAITDDNRIVQALPTIKDILSRGGKLVLFSHLGRVKKEEDKEGKSLAPIAAKLAEYLGQDVTFVPETRGQALEEAIKALEEGDVLMFENTRFEDVDGKKESGNDPELGKYWASLGDVFVNDAFGTAHRSHASNVGIATYSNESAAGYLLEKEIKFIGGAVDEPKRPFVAILGGAKVGSKIGVITNLLEKADKILIVGGMSYNFLKVQGYEIGTSLCEDDLLELTQEILDKAQGKLELPLDINVTKEFSNDAPSRIADYSDIKADEMGLDIGPKTLAKYKAILEDAKTVVWNGPAGVFEFSNFAKGTIGICEILAGLDNVTTIIGGGDSAAAAIQLGYADKFTHISTGGGASLEYLEGKTLPGVAAVDEL